MGENRQALVIVRWIGLCFGLGFRVRGYMLTALQVDFQAGGFRRFLTNNLRIGEEEDEKKQNNGAYTRR